ncbi:hypothetical protein KBB68_03145 [Candidatus Babeliales bacterium]|nr:hypothetical protein [Candidatus Babeliales bacterium]
MKSLNIIPIKFFIIFGFASNIHALLDIHRIPVTLNAWFKESPSNVIFENSWTSCKTSENFWRDPQAFLLQNCALETNINTHKSSCSIFANKKIITLTINTALLITIVAIAIAYKQGYFAKIKKYFNPCHDDENYNDKPKS